jgi:hypothetical protein
VVLLIGAVFVVAGIGCSGRSVEVVEVEGTVTQNGQPLDEVKVMFSPDPSKGRTGHTSQAITDENGKYRLKYKADQYGAEVGWHVINALDIKAENSRDNPIPNRIAAKYAQPATSGLSYEVKSGEPQKFDFELEPRPVTGGSAEPRN